MECLETDHQLTTGFTMDTLLKECTSTIINSIHMFKSLKYIRNNSLYEIYKDKSNF